MTSRALTLMAAMTLGTFGLACASSSSKNKDAATDGKADGASDGVASDVTPAPSDGAKDAPAKDAPADGASDTAADVPKLTELQARGQYLVDHVVACGDCHTPRGATGPIPGMYLAGNRDFIALPNGDKLPSRNLTNDALGLKNRTDAEIKAMFKDGKRPTPTGEEALNPVMPYYVFHNMDNDDADAIVAYLRTVPAVANDIPRRSASFDVTAPANYLDPATFPNPPSTFPNKGSATRGRYLATQVGLCIECHTPHKMGADVLETAKYFQGGEDFTSFFAATLMIKPVSKNLTSDLQTGLGMWTPREIVKVLKEGKAKDGSGICPPMPVGPMGAYGGLTADDALDIANYIASLPPAVNMIVDMCQFPPLPPDGGVPEGGAGDGTASETAGETPATETAAD
jgi:mono/diheme cytochrome c family protein